MRGGVSFSYPSKLARFHSRVVRPGRSLIARDILTRPPTGKHFHPPYPPIASQSISRDVPVAQASPFLSCAIRKHRYQYSFQARSFFSVKGVAWIGPQLRTSNEHILIVRVP